MYSKKILIGWLLGIMAIGAGGVLWLRKPTSSLAPQAHFPIAEFLEKGDGFTQVKPPWQFSFPRDHGAHPHYQTESWYFTGNLASGQGKHFGFQLNFFRVGLKPPEAPSRLSPWATKEVYRGHFAITDISQARFQASERFSRTALKLSGASLSPPEVWLENWRIQVLGGESSGSFRLQAATHSMSLDLTLHSLKPILRFGNDSSKRRSTFYAYQLPRLLAQGKVQIDRHIYPVKGLAWLDHTWGAVPIPTGPVVWDRFLLQLENGLDLLGFRLRRRDGSGTPISSGFLVDHDGKIQLLDRENLAIEVLDYWTSPKSKIRYPARWRFQIPSQELDLHLIPYVDDQELNLTLRYWGGTVQITGKDKGQTVKGQGYVELTGYRS
ncbi:MAG: lipocalin-like domain-containing protein [Candidatus Nitrosoglobus sp.]